MMYLLYGGNYRRSHIFRKDTGEITRFEETVTEAVIPRKSKELRLWD